jgi:isopentenyl-diphosphate Delta-isomerase
MAGVAADDLTSVDDAPAQPPGAARRSAAEQVVLLDETGRAVGTADKARVHHRTTPLHLAFSCYVFDPSRAVLTTRRALAKKTWPGVWTNSCCGHPLPGEPAATAVRRRLARELGLADVEQVTLVLPQFRYRATMSDATVENELCPVFTARTGARPRPAADEVDDVQWVPWSRFVDQVLHQGRDISPWCREQVAALDPLGPDPFAWPAADPDLLPPAAR